MDPPDTMIKQISVYTEEKFEDEEDLRERSLLASRVSRPHSSDVGSFGGSDAMLALAETVKSQEIAGFESIPAEVDVLVRHITQLISSVPERSAEVLDVLGGLAQVAADADVGYVYRFCPHK